MTTWAEFKQQAEKQGLKDDSELEYADWHVAGGDVLVVYSPNFHVWAITWRRRSPENQAESPNPVVAVIG